MAPPNDLAEFDTAMLWESVIQTMVEGLSAGDGIHAPAAPFRWVAQLLDEIVRRDPNMNVAVVAEFRETLERAFKGRERHRSRMSAAPYGALIAFALFTPRPVPNRLCSLLAGFLLSPIGTNRIFLGCGLPNLPLFGFGGEV